MSRPRILLDTNLVISAALFASGAPRRAFEWAVVNGAVLLTDALQTELNEVFLRQKFDRYVALDKRLRFLASFLALTVPIIVTEAVDVCRDPKDNKLLEAAISGDAECIVSGDADLLALHPFRAISILSPAAFLAVYALDSRE